MKQDPQTSLPGSLYQSQDDKHPHLCLYCGKYGHLIYNCFNKANSSGFQPHVSIIPRVISDNPDSYRHFKAHLQCNIETLTNRSLPPLSHTPRDNKYPDLYLHYGGHQHLADNGSHISTGSTSLGKSDTTPSTLSNLLNNFPQPSYRPLGSMRYNRPIPLQVLSSQQRQDLNHSRLCLYCGRYGHSIYNCSNRTHCPYSLRDCDTTPRPYFTHPAPVSRSSKD